MSFIFTAQANARGRSYDIYNFNCSLSIKNPLREKLVINENFGNKFRNMRLAYTNKKNELQHVFGDDQITSIFNSYVRFMANLYTDPTTQETKLLIGVYRMQKNLDKEKNQIYWSPESGQFQAWYAHPLAEGTSNIDLTSSDPQAVFTSIYLNDREIEFGCKIN